MKKVEVESLVKSFLLFFISQTLLVGALFFVEYNKELQTLDESLFNEMRVCSYDLKCDDFGIDFVAKDKYELYKPYNNDNELSAYFPIGGSQENVLKIYYDAQKYTAAQKVVKNDLLFSFLVISLVVVLLSSIFSLYTLSPLRNALKLTEEFIKDILHDFNTPLSTLRLNTSMLKDEIGENKKILRIENSVRNILSLQSNLHSYLTNHAAQKETFSLSELLSERIETMESNYKDIDFVVDVKGVNVHTNKKAFSRIVDNLLSNAAKYNKADGTVICTFKNEILAITDNGKGIENPKKVFDRFYKEQERGIGIGLHIVKKLCDELYIDISLTSVVDKGSTFSLNLSKLHNK